MKFTQKGELQGREMIFVTKCFTYLIHKFLSLIKIEMEESEISLHLKFHKFSFKKKCAIRGAIFF